MQDAHEGQTPAERDQVIRHGARTSTDAWDDYRYRRFNPPVAYTVVDKLTWWAMAERHFVPGLTTRSIPVATIQPGPYCFKCHLDGPNGTCGCDPQSVPGLTTRAVVVPREVPELVVSDGAFHNAFAGRVV
jgi:hypothetical protein